jgi:hypothetical protein
MLTVVELRGTLALACGLGNRTGWPNDVVIIQLALPPHVHLYYWHTISG